MIPFAKWQPDQYTFNGGIAADIKGVLPGGNSYVPWPELVPFSSALSEACRGAWLARTAAGTYVAFAATSTNLYKYAGATSAWTDITRLSGGDYNVPNDERWTGTQFGTDFVFANANDVLQVIDIDSESNCTALGGSPPQCRFVKTIGSQLFLGGLVDNPKRIQWSGRGNAEYFVSGMRDAGQQDFEDGGSVTGMTPLETGMVFQEGAIRRMTPVPNRAVYMFNRIEEQRGLIAPHSLVVIGKTSFYLSEDGFYATDSSGATRPIGANTVDKWFQSVVEYDRLYMVLGTADPVRQRVFWIFPASGNSTSYVMEYCLCYDIASDKFTYLDDANISHILGAAQPGWTVDTVDTLLTALGYTLETAPFSMDARFLRGGAPFLAAFDSDHKMAFFSGDNRAYRLETEEFQPVPMRRSFVRGVIPITDNASATIQVGSKERLQDSLSYDSAVAINGRGYAPTRASGRVTRIRMNGASGDEWTHVQGVEVDAIDDGER